MNSYSRNFFETISEGSRASAMEVAPIVFSLLRPRSVVDLGSGAGAWLAAFQQCGVSEILGIDGGEVPAELLRISPSAFLRADLRLPLHLGRRFELAVSLEVAEHLPPEFAPNFVQNLTALAPVVLFSAAVPYQGGTGHVNEQWPEYWASLFAEHGYAPADWLRMQLWNNERVEWWYAQNILLFANQEGLALHPELKAEMMKTDRRVLSFVHPRNYLRVADGQNLGLRAASAALFPALIRRIRRLIRL